MFVTQITDLFTNALHTFRCCHGYSVINKLEEGTGDECYREYVFYKALEDCHKCHFKLAAFEANSYIWFLTKMLDLLILKFMPSP